MPLELDLKQFCLTHELLLCQTVIVGVSGGADSMCLLDILHNLSLDASNKTPQTAFPQIIAAHIHHGLRGIDADRDENLVRNYCLDKNIAFLSRKVDVAALAEREKISIEQAGREARYSFFEEISATKAGETVYIAVAHHREDQAETILMNLFRGTGPDGLCGMKPKNGSIIRPLLFASKKEILAYLSSKKIAFCEDLTNLDNTYTRNRFRNQVLPLVADILDKDPVSPILAFSELASADQEYFDERVSEIFTANACLSKSGFYGLPRSVFAAQKKAIASRLIRLLYTSRFCCATDLSAVHVTSILALALSGSNNQRISLPHKRIAYLTDDTLFLDETSDLSRAKECEWNTKSGQILMVTEESKGEPLCFLRKNMTERVVSISKTSFEVEVILVENPQQVVYNNRTWYCPLQYLEGAVLRTRRHGDRVCSAGSTGGKLLRRFLTDRKIPDFAKDRMILVANESEVLWIPGVAHSQGFVDEISQRRYIESKGIPADGIFLQDSELYRLTILDRNEQEEH